MKKITFIDRGNYAMYLPPPSNKGVKKRSGFTLIELAIVLVVIGLITGGILVGQDLIQAGQLRSVISQVEKYETAANSFKLKYG